MLRPSVNISGNDCMEKPGRELPDCPYSDLESGFSRIPGVYDRPLGMDFCRQEAGIYSEIPLHRPLIPTSTAESRSGRYVQMRDRWESVETSLIQQGHHGSFDDIILMVRIGRFCCSRAPLPSGSGHLSAFWRTEHTDWTLYAPQKGFYRSQWELPHMGR